MYALAGHDVRHGYSSGKNLYPDFIRSRLGSFLLDDM
jgi:hypothetical protein